MASKNRVLNIVLKKFPESHQLISDLFNQSDFFRSICEDYASCVQVIKTLESSNRMSNKGYLEEYEELLQDLEKELILKLKE